MSGKGLIYPQLVQQQREDESIGEPEMMQGKFEMFKGYARPESAVVAGAF